jgi:hypothetical protein
LVGEPRSRHVAASAANVAGPVEQDVRELERLADDRGERETPRRRLGTPGAVRGLEQAREHLADASGDDVAVLVELGFGVEVRHRFGAIGGARGEARQAARQHLDARAHCFPGAGEGAKRSHYVMEMRDQRCRRASR